MATIQTYTKDKADILLAEKQATLVSSGENQNIKTINNQSILGSGNIEISVGGTVDTEMSDSSTNPVQNKVIKAYADTKIPKADIVDNLTTDDATKVLSAKQGKVLQDGKVNTSDIVDNLTSTDTDKPLSAKQGKVLNEKVQVISQADYEALPAETKMNGTIWVII